MGLKASRRRGGVEVCAHANGAAQGFFSFILLKLIKKKSRSGK